MDTIDTRKENGHNDDSGLNIYNTVIYRYISRFMNEIMAYK